MALLDCDFFSESLQMGTSATVVLPQVTATQIGVDAPAERVAPPVLYLLHGLSDDHTAWLRYTSIERYATAAGLAVVMPAVDRSFYTNEAGGLAYYDYVAHELPELVAAFFRVSTRPADTFVAGLSMGGYGAMKLALRNPGRFAAAASLSGALDVRSLAARPERSATYRRVFGDEIAPESDVIALLEGSDPASVPPLRVSCGTDDALLAANERFVELAAGLGIAVTSEFTPGDHTWSVWDEQIVKVIDWLPRSA